MTDLIEIKKVDGKVVIVGTILENQKNEDVLDYIKGRISATMNYQQYGFDKPILGIGGGGTVYVDNSDKFFGRGDEGLVIICPNREYAESCGISELYLMYDDEDLTEEIINF